MKRRTLVIVAAAVIALALLLLLAKGSSRTADRTRPASLSTAMFDLDLEVVFDLGRQPEKRGGGMSAIDDELILISGEGDVRVVDTRTLAISTPDIALPPLYRDDVARYVDQIEDEVRRKDASVHTRMWHRHDEILVFDSELARHVVISWDHFDRQGGCFTKRVAAVQRPPGTSLAKLQISAADWENGLVFESSPCVGAVKLGRHPLRSPHCGGRLALLDARRGRIGLTVGDFGQTGLYGPDLVSDANADHGKIFELDLLAGTKQVISTGHRNPLGLLLDDEGRLWSTEHGPRGGDELNLIDWGADYGWPRVTYGLDYEDRTWPHQVDQGRHSAGRSPVYAWVPSIGTSTVEQSISFHPFWERDLLVFAILGRSIVRLRMDGDHVAYAERIRFPDQIRQGLNHARTGSLFLWTNEGLLYRARPNARAIELVEEARTRNASLLAGEFASQPLPPALPGQCAICHGGASAPSLEAVVGRPVASTSFGDYSDALREVGGRWTEARLRSYLRDPQAFAPGTTMPGGLITSEAELDAVIEALARPRPPAPAASAP